MYQGLVAFDFMNCVYEPDEKEYWTEAEWEAHYKRSTYENSIPQAVREPLEMPF